MSGLGTFSAGLHRSVRFLLRRLARETRGAEIAEAAAVLPLMFMMLLGIFWFGQAFSIYGAITRAAQEGARAGAVPLLCYEYPSRLSDGIRHQRRQCNPERADCIKAESGSGSGRNPAAFYLVQPKSPSLRQH